MNRSTGATLIELMVALSIFSVVMGMLWMVMLSIRTSVDGQESLLIAQDDARNALLPITRELRQAAGASIKCDGSRLYYQIAKDMDGNGWAVDYAGNIEWSPLRTIAPDEYDANKDGFTMTQLVLTEEGSDQVRVLANHLDPAAGPIFEALAGNAVRITLNCKHARGAGSRMQYASIGETVTPRN